MNSDKKTCDEIQALLFDRAAGQLDGEARAALEEHLGACADCRKFADDMAVTAKALEAVPAIAPSERFEVALRKGVGAAQRRERLRVEYANGFLVGLGAAVTSRQLEYAFEILFHNIEHSLKLLFIHAK